MKRRTKIVIPVLILSAALSVAGYFGIRMEASRRAIERATSEQGVQCAWRMSAETSYKTPSSWQIVCGARPIAVHLHGSNRSPAFGNNRKAAVDFARALRFFGSIEDFASSVCPEIMTILRGVGRQPHLTQLNIFASPVTDEISSVVRGFPRLQGISLVPSQFTGRDFPSMPDLKAADFSFSPISVEGLYAITASPMLIHVTMGHHPDVSSSLRAAVSAIQASRPTLDIAISGSE